MSRFWSKLCSKIGSLLEAMGTNYLFQIAWEKKIGKRINDGSGTKIKIENGQFLKIN